MAEPAQENSYILQKSQTMSDFSETSSMGDTRQLVEEKDDGRVRSNIPMTSFNFINSIIGSGIIGIPFALKQAGFAFGIFLLILVAVVTDYSVLILIEAGKLSNTKSYQDMILVACGRPGFYILTTLQFLYPLIAMISYQVIIGDTITKVIISIGGEEHYALGDTILANRQFIIFLSTLLVTLPLSLYRDIAKLSKWAFLSLVLVLFILICICVRLATFAHFIPPTDDAWTVVSPNVAQAIGIMAFAYMCHHNTFLIHGSLENPTNQRWSFVTHVSIFFSMLMLIVLGIIGYVSFTGLVQGDLLENYCHDDDLMTVARFAFACTIMLTYPVECFVTREVLSNALFPTMKDELPLWRHIGITVGVAIITVVVSMATDCLGIVFTVNGVLVACPLAFIIPPVCLMKLRQEPLLSKSNIVPMMIGVFGSLVVIIGVVMAILNLSEGIQCSHGVEMAYCKNHQPTSPTPFSNFTTPSANFSLTPLS
ncbi:putative sodium-coupled neutral amino acid transporter 11 isoform X3 [Mizuhopecten yessoensis]|uniref:putative sodium-coupled neutral amino acid transporter 11 isoform X3 n=1 Tax=Mizuhopecten yessoensis TaxID=6573 RepID=UPI000B4586DE|nr:putative sodium-coupled neutral amino acid transporter 11 isoform X3 [Mizuhopecten yessoensis]XP_021367117.1 putative sodium-coupled neutral amino acid transporter 11 isoform X3 [Mizuhopecten yessoensis]XP_021367126.1 putative sodium-coupled neutral amino acid transporter 11 isoform X3 [Mizuhopecten yessoensis]